MFLLNGVVNVRFEYQAHTVIIAESNADYLNEDWTRLLNDFADDGWEYVEHIRIDCESSQRVLCIFKRPK
jgi:thiamine phosphate synthase YjbQ (UPF0047 family)